MQKRSDIKKFSNLCMDELLDISGGDTKVTDRPFEGFARWLEKLFGYKSNE